MPGEWVESCLGEVVELKRGYDLPERLRQPGTFPIVSSSGISGTHSEAKVRGPGVVTGRYGTIGKVYWIDEDYWPLNTTLYVRDFKGHDPKFIRYFLSTIDFLSCSDKAAVPGVNRNHLHQARVTCPPLDEQKAISHILGTLDDKIELNRKMNATLEAIARALFKSWFIDFDPVRAKADGGRPEEMDQKTAKLFPHSFQESRLGLIPHAWQLSTLSELCTIGRGGSPRPINDYMNGEVPWIKIADATSAGSPFLFETQEKLKREGVNKSVNVSPGDLILSNSATCGVPVFVELYGCIHDGWLYFKNLRSISKLYLFHILIELAEHLVHIADGSVQKNLNTALVGQQNVLVPPLPIVEAFDKHAAPWFAKMRQNGIESRSLAALRDALLLKLLSGELRIKDAERFVEASL